MDHTYNSEAKDEVMIRSNNRRIEMSKTITNCLSERHRVTQVVFNYEAILDPHGCIEYYSKFYRATGQWPIALLFKWSVQQL